MKQLMLGPVIYEFDKLKGFCNTFKIGKDDLVITTKRVYDNYLKYHIKEAAVLFVENYGRRQATDEMIEAMYENVKKIIYERVIAIGGGYILDIGKIFALKNISPVVDLFSNRLELIKEKELILVPTTCGTGSEVTKISILKLKSCNTKLRLEGDELYADSAVLIPELLQYLPYKIFVISSINALIHAMESYLSEKSTAYTRMFSMEAIKIILNGYKNIAVEGKEVVDSLLKDFLIGSNYAGVAIDNTGYEVLHAMSYPLCTKYKMTYGEANYLIFTEVFKTYTHINPEGKIKELNNFISELLGCRESDVYTKIDDLCNKILSKKKLSQYGVKEDELKEFAISVMEEHKIFISNKYFELTQEDIYNIYKEIY